MILVRNRQQLLNGNKIIIVFFIVLIAACSPKIKTANTKTAPKKVDKETNTNKPVKQFTQANIALFIPFKLNQYNLKTATKNQIDKANMAIDFYQGLMLGFDSAANAGLNFKLNVFDTRDDNSQLSTIIKKDAIKKSNLIIGPVFPEGIKYMSSFSIANDLPIVSPLAASKPSDFDNPNLISIVNNIDLHALKIVNYIVDHYSKNNTIVVLINPKKNDNEQFALPIRSTFKQKYPFYVMQEFTSTSMFEKKMIKDKKYAVIVCSSDVGFVNSSIDKLYKLKNLKSRGFDISLFGHPNWMKQTYNIEKLQDLNTIISTSYKIDYKDSEVISFIKNYRKKYSFEPTEYAFKGFDIGFYFGKLLSKHGESYLDFITKDKYKGLHNNFEFVYDKKYGYYNKALMLLQYKNLALNIID